MSSNEILIEEDQPALDAERAFEALRPKIEEYLNRLAQTEYGASLDIGNLVVTDYESWTNLVRRLTVESYGDPTKYVRTDKEHPIDQMLVLFSGGTSGSPKETYYAPEDSGIKLTKEREEIIKSSDFRFISESKDTVSFRLLKTWAEQARVEKAEYSGFDDLGGFLERCAESKGNVYVTLQVSSARSLFSQLAELLKNQSDLANSMPVLDNLYLDLVAEPIEIAELDRWYETLKVLFKVDPIITVPYAATEHKTIGLYYYHPGDTEIKYRVVDGLLVETTDPDTGRPVNGSGNLVITNMDKEFGSLYPRYDTGDRANVSYDQDGTTYISEVGRDPNKNQINLRGNKLYTHTFHAAIQDMLGPDHPIRAQFQLLENEDRTMSVLSINIGGDDLSQQVIDKARSVVSEFMNDNSGYRFLWQGGQEVSRGETYTAPNARIEFTYSLNLSWDNPKSFRRIPDTSIEKYYETQLELEMNDLLGSLPRSNSELRRFSLDTLEDLRAGLLSIIDNVNYDTVNPSFYHTDTWQNFCEVARNFNYLFEAEDEERLSKLAVEGSLDQALGTLGITGEQARAEVAALDLKPGSKVCFIGCGALPISVFEYAKLGIKVTGIDIDKGAIDNANDVAMINGIDGVEFVLRNGMELGHEDYDAIIVAAMVDNKEELISEIQKNNNVPILVRRPSGVRSETLYSPCKTTPKTIVRYQNTILEGGIY